MDRAGVRLGAPKAPAAGSPHWKSGRRNSPETSQQLSGLAGLVSLGNGHPLSEGDRRFFDSRFGFDFSRVRVHADAAAAETAAALDAAAFTIGSHIVFGRDRYRPGSGSGKALLAHELTHVVQQSVGPPPTAGPIVQRKPDKPGVVDRIWLGEDLLADSEATARRNARALIEALEQVAEYFDTEGWKLPASVFNRTWSRDARVLLIDSFNGPPRSTTALHNQFERLRRVQDVARALIRDKLDDRADLRDALDVAYLEALRSLRASVSRLGATKEDFRDVDAGIASVADKDFEVRGLSPEAMTDSMAIYFERNSSTIPSSEGGKILSLAAPSERSLTVRGFASEDEAAGSAEKLIARRVDRVAKALAEAGHDVDALVLRKKQSGEVGRIEYRDLRKVTIVPTPPGKTEAPTSELDCSSQDAAKRDCGTSFTTAFPIAEGWVEKAVSALSQRTPAAQAELDRLFPGVNHSKVRSNVARIQQRLREVGTLKQFECHSKCDPACDSPAYIDHSGDRPKMILCPGFLDDEGPIDRAETILHETTHMMPELWTMRARSSPAPGGTTDIAGRQSRPFLELTPEQMIENADSYVALIRLIHTPGSITTGPGELDVLRGGDPNRPERAEEERTARRALAFLETWVYWGREDTSYTYSSVVNALSNPSAWPASANDRFGRRVLHQIAGIFGLTDPGETEPPARLPTTEDKLKLAAIYDRFAAMFHTMWSGRVVMTISSGLEAWGPELAPRVQVQQSFFQMSSADQIRHLVMLMATSMTSISPALRIKYVDAADLIRKIRGVGP